MPQLIDQPFTYWVRQMIRIVDGDTFDVALELQPQTMVYVPETEFKPLYDFGFRIYAPVAHADGAILRDRFRLYPVDAWEVRGPERPLGLKAAEFCEQWFRDRMPVVAVTQKDTTGRYGRWLADFVDDDESRPERLSVALITEGLATIPEYLKDKAEEYLREHQL